MKCAACQQNAAGKFHSGVWDVEAQRPDVGRNYMVAALCCGAFVCFGCVSKNDTLRCPKCKTLNPELCYGLANNTMLECSKCPKRFMYSEATAHSC